MKKVKIVKCILATLCGAMLVDFSMFAQESNLKKKETHQNSKQRIDGKNSAPEIHQNSDSTDIFAIPLDDSDEEDFEESPKANTKKDQRQSGN